MATAFSNAHGSGFEEFCQTTLSWMEGDGLGIVRSTYPKFGGLQRREKLAQQPGETAKFSRLYKKAHQRHHTSMFKLETFIAALFEFLRTLLIEVLSDRVRTLHRRGPLRGMNEVRRRVHRDTRERLINRVSTQVRR